MGKDVQELTPDQRIKLLELELKHAKSEATKLRKAILENSRHGRRIKQAYADALLLAELHIGYQPSSRSYGRGAGISRRRWSNAIALLQLARVYNCRKFIAHSLTEIEAALGKAQRIALENPAAFLARLPTHANDKAYRHGKFAGS